MIIPLCCSPTDVSIMVTENCPWRSNTIFFKERSIHIALDETRNWSLPVVAVLDHTSMYSLWVVEVPQIISRASPCLHLFLPIHNDHMPHKKTEASLGGNNASSIKSCAHVWGCSTDNLTAISLLTSAQKNLAIVQSIKTCLIDSSSGPHTSQFAVRSMCLRNNTSLAGKRPFTTHHQKTRTLGGTQRPQIPFHVLSLEDEALPFHPSIADSDL